MNSIVIYITWKPAVGVLNVDTRLSGLTIGCTLVQAGWESLENINNNGLLKVGIVFYLNLSIFFEGIGTLGTTSNYYIVATYNPQTLNGSITDPVFHGGQRGR